jgi:hypothetical protein
VHRRRGRMSLSFLRSVRLATSWHATAPVARVLHWRGRQPARGTPGILWRCHRLFYLQPPFSMAPKNFLPFCVVGCRQRESDHRPDRQQSISGFKKKGRPMDRPLRDSYCILMFYDEFPGLTGLTVHQQGTEVDPVIHIGRIDRHFAGSGRNLPGDDGGTKQVAYHQ